MFKIITGGAAATLLALSLVVVPASAHERKKPVARDTPTDAVSPALSPEFKQQLLLNGWWQFLR